jgi:hypothetical protein
MTDDAAHHRSAANPLCQLASSSRPARGSANRPLWLQLEPSTTSRIHRDSRVTRWRPARGILLGDAHCSHVYRVQLVIYAYKIQVRTGFRTRGGVHLSPTHQMRCRKLPRYPQWKVCSRRLFHTLPIIRHRSKFSCQGVRALPAQLGGVDATRLACQLRDESDWTPTHIIRLVIR